MLEIPADDGPDADVVGHADHAGAQTAHASHDEIDVDPGLRRRVERLDHVGVDEAVDLHAHTPRAGSLGVRLDLVEDELFHAGPQRVRRGQQCLVAKVAPVPRQVVEEMGQVRADVGMTGWEFACGLRRIERRG